MTIPSNNIQDDAYEAVGHGARGYFSPIGGGFTQKIQQALAKHLEEKGIDINTLSTQEKHTILTKFIENDHIFDKDLLPNNLKRESIAKENYFLDEILHDSSLSAYTNKTQWSISMAQAIVVATINNLLALSGLPTAMIQELKDLLAQDRSNPIFTSIDAFRSHLEGIINFYNEKKNPPLPEKLLQWLQNILQSTENVKENFQKIVEDENNWEVLPTIFFNNYFKYTNDTNLSPDELKEKIQDLINMYTPGHVDAVIPTQYISDDMHKDIHNVSIENNHILDTLKSEWAIDEDTYNTLKTENYEKRPEEYQKAFATQLRKQFTYSYIDNINVTNQVGDSIISLTKVPTLKDVIALYCQKLWISYADFVRQQEPWLDFSSRSLQEKQGLMDTMVEEYYIPNADKLCTQVWLDPTQYKDFVKKLFSLNEKTITIPWADGKQRDLTFIKKDIEGVLTVDSVDGLGDLPIPFNFVLDASQEQEIQKLATMMPNKQRISIDNKKYDPQQQLSLTINNSQVDAYAYKIMHDGKEKSVLTDQYIQPGEHTTQTKVITKDGSYKPLDQTNQEEVVILDSESSEDARTYNLWPKEPLVYSVQPQDVSGILGMYALNNTSNLSESDKEQLFPDQAPATIVPDLFEQKLLKNNSSDDTNKTKEVTASSIKSAKDAWDKIPWRGKKFEEWWFAPGVQIVLQCTDSIFKDIPGSWWFMILEIVDADDRKNPTQFKYKIVWWSESDINSQSWGNLRWRESEMMDFNNEFLHKIRDFWRWTIFKLPPQHNYSSISDFIQDTEFGSWYGEMDKLKGKFVKLTAEWWSLKRDSEKIKYFGKKIVQYDQYGESKSKYVMFVVDFQWDTVVVKDPKWSYNHTMNYAQFIIFAADKGLDPYTQKDHDSLVNPPQNQHATTKPAVYRFSLNSIRNGGKNRIQNGFLANRKKLEERGTEKIEEFWYSSWVNKALSNLPWIGEHFYQAQNEFENKQEERNYKLIMEGDQTLGQWWKKMVWWKKTFVDKHNKKGPYRKEAFDKIIELFEKAKKWSLTESERRESFAAMLYVLEKFQTLYPMFITKYAGQNLWAKMLLSPKQYAIYQQKFYDAKTKLDSGQAVGDEVRELTDDLAQFDTKMTSELMKDTYLRSIYSDKAVKELQKSMDVRSNDTPRKDGYSAAKNHTSFDQAFTEEIDKKIKDGRIAYVIGALVQVSQRKEIWDPQNYRRWMSAVLAVILSGGINYATNKWDKKYLRDFLRKHGLPISEYILDTSQWGKDLATLLDTISPHAKCSQKFSDAVWWNAKTESYEKRSEWGLNYTFYQKFNGWFLWEWNAFKITPFLENSNLGSEVNLATIAASPDISGDQKRILGGYLKVSLNAHPARDYDAYRWGDDFVQDIIQDRAIFNVSRQLMQEEYMRYQQDGTFGKNEESVWYFWESLKKQFAGYASKETIQKPALTLIVKKYYSLFQQQYGGTHQWFAAMMALMQKTTNREERKRYAKAFITNYIKKNNSYYIMPTSMASAFDEIEDFFVNHIDAIDDDIIKDTIMFEELDGTAGQKDQSIRAYKMMQDHQKHPKEYEAVQKYIKDLTAGKISWWSKWFTFDNLDISSNGESGEGAMSAIGNQITQRLSEEQRQQNQSNFDNLIASWDAELNNSNFDEAIRLYEEADRLWVDPWKVQSKIQEANNQKDSKKQQDDAEAKKNQDAWPEK